MKLSFLPVFPFPVASQPDSTARPTRGWSLRHLFIALFLSSAPLSAANLLVNPDFEAQTLPDPGSSGFIDDWGDFAATIIHNSDNQFITAPLNGNVVRIMPAAFIVQTLDAPLIAETTYRVSLDYRVPTSLPHISEGVVFRFGIGLGTGTGSSSFLTDLHLPLELFVLGGEGTGHLLTSTAEGAYTHSVSFEFTTGWYPSWTWNAPAFYVMSDENNVRTLYFDNVSFSIVPEPSLSPLLLLGLILFLARQHITRSSSSA